MGKANDFNAIFRPATDDEIFKRWYKNPAGYKQVAQTHSAVPWQNDDGAIRIVLNRELSMLSSYVNKLYNHEVNYSGMEYGCYVDLPKRIKWFSDRYQVEGKCLKKLKRIIERLNTNGSVDDKFLAQSTKVIEEVRNLCAKIQRQIKRKSAGIFINVDNLPRNWQV